MRKILSLALIFIATLVAAPIVFSAGQSNCVIVYGGGEVCPEEHVKFTINKQVQAPSKGGAFVENLTINDPRLTPAQNVNFRIIIENTGDKDITDLNVVDTFPEFLSFVAGVGNTNVGAKEVKFIVGKLAKGEKRELLITAKTAEANKLPANQAITCVTNNARATTPDGVSAEDNAQVCIEKQVLGVQPTPQVFEKVPLKQIPPTGPELSALFALIPAGLSGIYLRRKAR